MHGTEKVPAIAFEVQEYRDFPVRLNTGRRHKLNSSRNHPLVRSPEVVDAQEEPNAAGELLSDDRVLMIAVGACEQNAGRPAARSNDNPTLGAAIVRQCRPVFHEIEAQAVHEKVDRRVVLAHDEGHALKVSPCGVV